MRNRFLALLSLAVILLALGNSAAPSARATHVTKKIVLFNGKNLDNFYTFLRGIGVGKDPKKVFTVQDGMIRVSGEQYGYFVTAKEYDNYHLVVEFKWGEETHPPRKGRSRDSGVLLHCVGKDGGANGTWMTSIECQMIEGGTGDFILVGTKETRPSIKAKVTKKPTGWYYDPKGEERLFNGGRVNWYGRSPKWKDIAGFRGENEAENPSGQWNKLEVICDGGTITNILNGKVVNRATEASLRRGKILFQSEGAELFFRKIELHPLKK